jgi:CBS domain-containing protein
MPTDHLPLRDAGPEVRDAMLLQPRATPAATPASQARETFANPHVMLLLVVDEEGRFAGTLTREDLPDDAPADATVGQLVRGDAPRVGPDAPLGDAVELLRSSGDRRLPVVDGDGVLCGLVCMDRGYGHFCVDKGRVAAT